MDGVTAFIKCLKSSCSFINHVHSSSCSWTKATVCFSWKYRVKHRLDTLLSPGRSLIREAHRNTYERIGGRILWSKLHFDISFSFPSLLCSTHLWRKTGEPFIIHWEILTSIMGTYHRVENARDQDAPLPNITQTTPSPMGESISEPFMEELGLRLRPLSFSDTPCLATTRIATHFYISQSYINWFYLLQFFSIT